MQNAEQFEVKTGTLKPPHKPSPLYAYHYAIDESVLRGKAEDLCHQTGKPVVIFHDERGGMSLCAVNNLERLHKARNILFGYKQVKGRIEGGELW